MIVTVFILALLGAQGELPVGGASPPAAATTNFQTLLRSDEGLRDQHRGYRHYLLATPKIARAELAWLDVVQLPTAERVAAGFDEALNDDPVAQQLFDQFYDQLARDKGLRDAVEGLQRAEFGEGRLGSVFSDVMTYFRGNPDSALRFLRDPTLLGTLPSQFAPMLRRIARRPEVLESLQGALTGVTDLPIAHTRVFPWWTTLGPFDAAHGGAYGNLAGHFAKYPHHFWAWHQRNLVLAEDAQARDWIRYWHRKVRRTAGFGAGYRGFIRERLSGEVPGMGDVAGVSELAWPPKAAPPLLPSLGGGGATGRGVKGGTARGTERRFQVPPAPPRPARPVAPPRPVRPEAPVRPVQD